jgi:CDP-diacylglycerol--glycerol-3-phosphate 3-phosphatidyltransferase
MIPVFLVLLLVPGIPYGNYIATAVFVIACASDAVDGHIARKYNLVTNFGKFMDPLADKLLVCSALICFVELSYMPAWVVIVITAREFIISGFRTLAADNGVVIAAGVWGKLKTIVQMVMCIVLLLQLPFGFMNVVEQILIYLALALTVISLVEYIWKNKKILSETK